MTKVQCSTLREKRYRAVFCFLIFGAACLASLVGFNLDCPESCMIIPSLVDRNDFWIRGAVQLCVGDLVTFWLIGLGGSRRLRLVLSCTVFFIRGLLIGSSLRMVVGNSVTVAVVLFLISYVIITLLAMACDGYLNTGYIKKFVTRAFACVLATGAATVIRLLPVLILDL